MRNRKNTLLMEQEKMDMTPMIDCVFQLIIFFLVTTTQVREEADLVVPLASDNQPPADNLPPEYTIGIGESGQIYLDEQPVDGPEESRLTGLASRLQGLRDSAPGGDMIVTLAPDDNSSHVRTVSVLNVLASLNISKITFAGGASD